MKKTVQKNYPCKAAKLELLSSEQKTHIDLHSKKVGGEMKNEAVNSSF